MTKSFNFLIGNGQNDDYYSYLPTEADPETHNSKAKLQVLQVSLQTILYTVEPRQSVPR